PTAHDVGNYCTRGSVELLKRYVHTRRFRGEANY
ncbi:MAG: hypothetical protein ACI9HK_004004, partial [Pirellulaceae bacterium]